MPACADTAGAGAALASPNEWRQIFALLDTALELDPSARTGWLATLGPEQAHLGPMLAQLLQTNARVATDDFLRSPPGFARLGAAPRASPTASAPLALLEAGALVGAYRLLREIGQGGMASVWLAERADGLLERRVALKLPHPSWGAMDLAERMARERNILASLTHPHIARLYDAGLAGDGRPFIALEYVEGAPIDEHAAAQGLTVRARVALAVQVARAVAYAHAQLVVHRDLKPSNILVDAQGQAHLLDFGIAKLVDPLPGDGGSDSGGSAGHGLEAPDTLPVTQAAGRALTPDYASPEQIRGDPIGTASDIYSLGVVVFELLAGVRPYRLDKSLGAVALAEAIERVRVPRASEAASDPAVGRPLAGDLDAILARALAKPSTERYATMAAFADDLERHLRGEPVKARPDGWWYHTERWVRRHKLEAAVGAAIVVAVPAGAAAQAAVLVAIGAGAAVALWQMRVARRQAQAARDQAARAEQVKDFTLSILQGANTDSGAGAATTASDLLKAARVRVERELSGQPETAVELMTSIGDGLLGLGELRAAAEVLGQAVALANRELGLRHRHTPAVMVVYGSVLVSLDRPKEARAVLVPAIAEARRQNATHALVDGLRWLSSVHMSEANTEAGLAAARAAVDALSSPGAKASTLDAVNAWASLSNALNVAQRAGQADAARRALEFATQLYGTQLTESVLAVRMLLAKGLATEGRDAQALDELDAVLADTTRFFGSVHPKIEGVANFRGHVRLDSGDTEGAIEDFRLQLVFAERAGGAGGTHVGLAHSALGKALAAADRSAEALVHYETSARLLREATGADGAFVARSESMCALLLARLGRLAEAEAAFAELAGAGWVGAAAERDAHAGRFSELRRLQGRHAEAVELAAASAKGLRAHPSTIVRATASAALGSALLAAGRPAEAIEPLREAVRLFSEKQLAVSPQQSEARAALARAEAVAGTP